ncbi:MAG: hypothetical protein HGA59_06510 [Chlorobiaceae bacterium]|jgi:hypothetical protein|nr:hypothetical protein [Chlorobiaceae bacterium]
MIKKAGPGSTKRFRCCRKFTFLLCGIVSSLVFLNEESSALPVFARKYHTACSTCHIAFPVRNGFGEAFRNNGYRFPSGTDEEMVKEEPIKLGQEAYKNIFPNAIWPSDMPNMPSLGFLAKARIYMPEDNGNFKETKFAEDLETFFAGTITEHITYFGDFAINQDGVEWGKLNLLWAFRPGLNLVLGEVGFTEKMTLIPARPGWKRDGYATTMPTPSRGVELRFAGNTGECGGYSLAAGIGKNSTENAEDTGNFTDSRFVRGTWKIGGNGLLSGVGGTLGNNAIGMDNSVTFGVNYFNSSNGTEVASQENLLGFVKTGYSADVEASYGSLRLLAQYARLNEVLDDMGIDHGKRDAISLEGDYWIYPWLFGVVRYEYLKDNYNGKITKIIPGIAAMLRPNAKIGLEYVSVKKDALADLNSEAKSSIAFFAQVGF